MVILVTSLQTQNLLVRTIMFLNCICVCRYEWTEGKEFSFNQLCDKAYKVRYKLLKKERSYSEIKKGYEVAKNEYIVIDKEDLDRIKLKTTNTIEVKEFVDEKELDPILIEKSYYIGPDNKKVAVGKVVLRDKEHLVPIRPYQRELVMHVLHYLDDIRPADEIPELKEMQKVNLDNKELSLGKLLVENLSSTLT